MKTEYDFAERLAFSRGVAESTHPDTIMKLVPGCVSVRRASEDDDLRGIDFVARLRGGAELRIDIKSRDRGCSRFWKPRMPLFGMDAEPEIALEKWSEVPCPSRPSGKSGWTLDERKLTDYTLHVFDPSDSREVFLLPFQLLRMAFIQQIGVWYSAFKVDRQMNNGWISECVFVPAWCVIQAVAAEMRPQGSG